MVKCSQDFRNFRMHGFWSKSVTGLKTEMRSHHGKSYATHHDLILRFINEKMFDNKGIFNKEFRTKGKTYPDLVVPSAKKENLSEILELRAHTSELKYLRQELNFRESTFSSSDYLYFAYFLRRRAKIKDKRLKPRTCIYYLVIIIFSKTSLNVSINELVADVKMGAEEFTKKLAEESGVDPEKEELLGVQNMLKVDDLERELEEVTLELEEKDAIIAEKDREIQRLKNRLQEKK